MSSFSRLFRFTGRRGRLSYFLAGLAIWAACICAGGIGIYAARESDVAFFAVLPVIVIIGGCVASLSIVAQRIRDIGWSVPLTIIGLMVLGVLTAVPIPGFALLSLPALFVQLALLFVPGRKPDMVPSTGQPGAVGDGGGLWQS